MDGIIPELRFADKQKLIRRLRKCRDAGLKTRYLVIVNLFRRSVTQTATALHIARSTVYRVAERFRQLGEWGLWDRREDNGESRRRCGPGPGQAGAPVRRCTAGSFTMGGTCCWSWMAPLRTPCCGSTPGAWT